MAVVRRASIGSSIATRPSSCFRGSRMLSMASVDVPRLLREKAEELVSLRESLSQWVQDDAAPQSSGAQRAGGA
ncbi:hypothetical protein EMIT053CA3_90196 [Pseudomonas donghuensis]